MVSGVDISRLPFRGVCNELYERRPARPRRPTTGRRGIAAAAQPRPGLGLGTCALYALALSVEVAAADVAPEAWYCCKNCEIKLPTPPVP